MRQDSASSGFAARVAGLLLALALLLVLAPSAAAAPRATLTWDTDDTDIDLHVWDEFGNHAYFGNQDAILGAELSTDILYGFGPENFEEFVGDEGRTYTYGVCYYGSNRADDVVPDTVATVDIRDPAGGVRTLRRVLRQEKDAYYLGSSPVGSDDEYFPDGDWCADGPYHPESDGGPDPASTGGGGGSFEGCTRTRRRIGVVELCADALTGAGANYSARGNVRVNGSVLLGDGPFAIDTGSNRISGTTPVVSVVRADRAIPVAGGYVVIQADAVTDPLSGRDQLAKLEIGEPIPAAADALRAAGVPVSLTALTDGRLSLYLDGRDGGGVVAAAKVRLPFADGRLSAGDVAIGVHGRTPAPVRVLAGSASFGDVALPGGWRLGTFALTYSEAENRWSATGSLGTPQFGLDLAGGLADGQLDALGVGFTRDVPLGNSGFILSHVGGNVSGLAVPPLKIAATASGRWGSVPGLSSVGLILLRDVKLTLDFSGAVSLDGTVDLIKSDSPVSGSLALSLRFAPSFKASGKLQASAKLAGVELSADNSMTMTTSAFTALGGARGELRGLTLASARSVVSNKGVGASGNVKICVFRACINEALGFGMNWRDFPRVRWIGGDIDQFVTASARRGGRRTIVVEPDRPLLFVDATGPAGTRPAFSVRGPRGRTWTSAKRRPDSTIVTDAPSGFVGLTILRPRPGRYVVTPRSAAPGTRFQTQSIRRTARVHATRLSPAGTKRRPLRRRGGALRLRWTSRGLPRTTRVAVQLTGGAATEPVTLTSGRRARGSVRIPRKRLARGANRFRLVVSDRGIPVYDVPVRRVVRMR